MTKVELEDRITKLQEQHVELVNLRDVLRKDLAEARMKYEGALKDIATAREETTLAKENLARALGYIDRINDMERQPVPAYVPPPSPPSNNGPVMQAPAKDQYGRRY